MDLREYLAKLKEIGELREVSEEVHWNLEAAAFSAMMCRVGGPGLLFNKITGCPSGYRLAGNIFAGTKERPWRRYALMLDLDPDIEYMDFVEKWARRVVTPVRPTVVSTGPCKEEIHIGKEVNIFEFPIPYLHEGDGGRYGTIQCFINKDPDSEWVNWANYRFLVHTRNKLGILMSHGQQGADLFYRKYEARGNTMPFCISIGGDPVYFIASVALVPEQFSEVDLAGSLRQEPIQLVKAETNDLLVPADAEIVIEGEVRPHERADEGPFGEYFGFMHGPRTPRPVLRINAITHRKNPIIPFVVEGMEGSDGQCLSATSFSMGLYTDVRTFQGFPIKSLYYPMQIPYSFPVIATEVSYQGYIHEVANFLFSHGAFGHNDHVCFVDSDVNPADMDQVLEEIALKVHPTRDFHIGNLEAPKVTLNVYQSPQEKEVGLTAKVYIDATTKRKEGLRRLTFETLFPEEIQKWAVENWKEIGFEERPKWRRM